MSKQRGKKRRRRRAGKLVPAAVVATELGVSIWTVRRWIDGGTMRGVNLCGRWYASRTALDAIRTALSGI